MDLGARSGGSANRAAGSAVRCAPRCAASRTKSFTATTSSCCNTFVDEAEFERLYGPWDPLDPAEAQEFLADFPGPWWVVGRGPSRPSPSPPRAPRRGRGDLQVRHACLARPGGRPVRRVEREQRLLASDQRDVARASPSLRPGGLLRARSALGDRPADQRGPRRAGGCHTARSGQRRSMTSRGWRSTASGTRTPSRAAPQGTRERGEDRADRDAWPLMDGAQRVAARGRAPGVRRRPPWLAWMDGQLTCTTHVTPDISSDPTSA